MHITTFPNEILLQIFGEIDIADIYNLKRTCRQFNVIASHSRHICIFKVDAPGHPTWKLLKYLLRNQDVGKQIKEIRVEWHRRRAGENSWVGTEQWTWTDREVNAIKDIPRASGRMYIAYYSNYETAIFGGINSEVLLPLLLILSPKVESLDLGAIDERLIAHNSNSASTHKDALEVLLNLYSDDYRTQHCIPNSIGEWYTQMGIDQPSEYNNASPLLIEELCRDAVKTYSRAHTPAEQLWGAKHLWLQQTMVDSDGRFPGLNSLKKYTCTTSSYSSYTDVSHQQIFSLPNIEIVLIDGCFPIIGLTASRVQWGSWDPEVTGALITKNSGLRKIELLRAHVSDKDLELLAKMTVNLEYLAIERVNPSLGQREKAGSLFRERNLNISELPLEHIGQSFLENNKKLSMEGVIILDYTGQKWGNGSFGGVNQ